MRKFRLFKFLTVIGALVFALNACADSQQSQLDNSIYVDATVPIGQTLSASYLSGRFAQRQDDWHAAQKYMSRVTAYDASNPVLNQRVFLLSIGAEDHEKAAELAKVILSKNDKIDADLPMIYLACYALRHGQYEEAKNYLENLPEEGFGEYTKPLLLAWAYVGLGDTDKAHAIIKNSASADDPAYLIHAGLIEELSGNIDEAKKYYTSALQDGMTMHGAILMANFFEQHGEPHLAKSLYNSLGSMYTVDTNMYKSKDAAQKTIQSPAEGAAIALFDLASLLYERQSYDSAQIYGSIVRLLQPDSPFALLMLGDIAALNGNYSKSLRDYNGVHADATIYWLAQMRVAEVYDVSGQFQKAESKLKELSKNSQTRLYALVTLGDLYRQNENFADAITAYDDALSSVDSLTNEYWSIVYARGMSLERMNNWDMAEKDLLTALDMQPDNPMILNYIGYSWLEKGLNMDKALEFTRRAAALRPNDGYIVDSYGWALFLNGEHAEAVKWLERAISLMPENAVILDHLGDAYWHVGRKNEARFKWKRAADASLDQTFKTLVHNKITTGLDTSKQASTR